MTYEILLLEKHNNLAAMNSIEISAFQLQLLMGCSSSSTSDCILPPPPESLPTNPSMLKKICPAAEDEQEFDCSKFASPPSSICSTTVASSVSSLSSLDSATLGLAKGWGSTLSRSRCVSNLSALGSVASETSISRRSSYESKPHEASWGYFVDTTHDR
ncbi:hypothetical protein ACHAXM_001625 [Skeletonema potamos]